MVRDSEQSIDGKVLDHSTIRVIRPPGPDKVIECPLYYRPVWITEILMGLNKYFDY